MKKFVSLILALTLAFSVMLTGCSASVTIPGTSGSKISVNIPLKDAEKVWDIIQGNTSSSDKDEDKDDDDTDYPTVGSVDIRNTIVTKDSKGNITRVEFDVTMITSTRMITRTQLRKPVQ